MAALASKCVGKWGAAAQGVNVVSWRSWRWGAIFQAGVLEVGCIRCFFGILESWCNQSVWGPVIGHRQLAWGSWKQGTVSLVRAPEAGSDLSG